MRRPLWISLAVVLVVTLGALTWLSFRSNEPAFQGKSLTAWLQERRVGPSQEAENATRQIGTNALPTLLKMVIEANSPDQEALLGLARRQSELAFDFYDADEDHNLAPLGFFVLGPTGKGAVTALTNLVTDPNPIVRRTAIACLGSIGPAAQDAVPALIPAITDFLQPQVQATAKFALGAIHAQAAIAVPALTNSLSVRGKSSRLLALSALGKFGVEAKVAVPVLLPLLNDPDLDMRSATSNALKMIDPEAAIEAGVK